MMVGVQRFFTLSAAFLLQFGFVLSSNTATASTLNARLTVHDNVKGELSSILSTLSARTGLTLSEANFTLEEDRDLATSHYSRYAQTENGLPLRSRYLRIWKTLDGAHVIQAEANLDTPEETTQRQVVLRQSSRKMNQLLSALSPQQTIALARQAVRSPLDQSIDDRKPGAITWRDEWVNNQPTRLISVNSKRGTHHINVSLLNHLVTSHTYAPYPQADAHSHGLTIPAQVFPVYELDEHSGKILDRVSADLKYINPTIKRPESGDLYAPLRAHRYYESFYNPLLGETEEGRAAGYWSMQWILQEAQRLRESAPLVPNTFDNGGVFLEGAYCTVSMHEAVATRFSGFNFQPTSSIHLKPDWRVAELDGEEVWEMVPSGSLRGRPLTSLEDALARPARLDPQHNPVTYINDGFDEMQVYYAVNQMFDVLRPMGFTDPDLSTRPFHAFLFDPDISMRDNAYYTNDTINFTTYSPGQQNMARDNPTIWHELGHGVMDRMMGDRLHLADTGGLSEGMADFIAQLVFKAVTQGEYFPGGDYFRIVNRTGFHLTNEVHDDGEAYGGAMNDLLQAAIARFGFKTGLSKTTDLVLEAMRLTRDHQALTAEEWFNHVLYADELGNGDVRSAGELHELVVAALAGRNFSLTSQDRADFSIYNVTRDEALTSDGPGSRERAITVNLTEGEQANFTLKFATQNAPHFEFKYPLRVVVSLNGGPIQGAVNWVDEATYPRVVTLADQAAESEFTLGANATCNAINRDDGSCVDFAYIQVFNNGETQPIAKKRFYLRVRKSQ